VARNNINRADLTPAQQERLPVLEVRGAHVFEQDHHVVHQDVTLHGETIVALCGQ